MQYGVLDFGIHENHHHLFFGLNGDVEKRFGFLVRGTAAVQDGTTAGARILGGLHHRFGEARIHEECKDDEDDTYDRYLNENAEMYRARKEGFARKISLGFRAAGGMNMVFGKKAGNWEIGYEGSAGIFAKMPFFSRLLTLYPELDFDYRVFKFESESDYSKDEASITQMLFEIPILFVFAPDNEGFFVGIGPDLGLKLSSKSKYKQEVDTGKKIEKDKRKNTLPTAGVLLGGAFDIGYAFNSHFTVDIRVVQYLSNLVNEKAVAETEIMDSKLYTFHTTLGISFAL